MDRLETIKREMARTPVCLCPERAYLVTEFYKKHADPAEPVVVRKARALHYLLSNKSVEIWPGELIVGNPGTTRKACIMQPELASAFMATELLWIDRRKTNPFPISAADKLKLATRVLPYWVRHSMPAQMFPGRARMARYMKHQLRPTFYLINEAGGIGHFLPDYGRMLKLGTRGYREELEGKEGPLALAARIVCDALEVWAARFAGEAERQARSYPDGVRRAEQIGRAHV